MDREEILKKAQNRKANQMELDILQKSSYVGIIIGLIVCLILMCIKMFYNQSYQDIYSVYCSVLCGQNMYKWFRQKEKAALFCGVIWGLVAVVLFVVYITKIL